MNKNHFGKGIYIYIKRERERERESLGFLDKYTDSS